MPSTGDELSVRSGALISGIALIIMMGAAIVGTDGTINRLVVDGDAAATVHNLTTSVGTFRIGLFSWLIIFIADLFVAWGLYLFFKPVNRDISLVMAWSRLVYLALLGAALSHYVKVMLLIEGTILPTIGTELLQFQIMLSLKMFQNVWAFGLIIFGIHLFFLGYLILKSGYVPRIFGYLMLIAFIGYLLIETFTLFLPHLERVTTILGWIFILPMISEVALGVWMLIKGTKVPDL